MMKKLDRKGGKAEDWLPAQFRNGTEMANSDALRATEKSKWDLAKNC